MKSKTKTLPTDAVLRDMLKQAGLDSAGVQFRLLGDGMFNAVFAAETNPPVVMKIAPRPQVPVMTYERDMLATELYWYDQIRQHTEITVPDILYSDPVGNLCGAPWVVMERLPGVHRDKCPLPSAEKHRRTAEMVAQIHNVFGTGYGYVQNGLYENWADAYISMIENLLADARRMGKTSRRGQRLLAYARQYRAVLAAAPANSGLQLECRAAILMEPETGRVLYEKAPDERMPIASITKLMTLLLTFEAIRGGKLTLDTPVPVSEHAYHMGGSQIWLEPGEQFTLDEMLRAICVSSANDAAVAVAELVGGSEPVFVEQMNARAAELGMTNTTFRNACGLDTEGHLSTARDVAVLSRYLLNTCPELLHYTGIWTDSLRNGQTQLVNTNKLLRRYSGITGLKTGTTSGAGVCISASATRDGLTLIAVVLGSPSSADRFHSATTLLDYGFANYAAAPLPTLPERPLALAVKGSAEDGVPLDYAALPETILIEKGTASALRAELTLPEALEAPVEKGQTVGKVSIFQDDTLLNEYEVKAAADAPLLTFGGALELLWQCLLGA